MVEVADVQVVLDASVAAKFAVGGQTIYAADLGFTLVLFGFDVLSIPKEWLFYVLISHR